MAGEALVKADVAEQLLKVCFKCSPLCRKVETLLTLLCSYPLCFHNKKKNSERDTWNKQLTTESQRNTTCGLTKHDEVGRPLFVSRGVGGVLAGVTASVGHFEVWNLDGWVLQCVMEEDDPVFEGQVGETLSVDGVENSDVVSLTIDGLPYPRHLEEQSLNRCARSMLRHSENKKKQEPQLSSKNSPMKVAWKLKTRFS